MSEHVLNHVGHCVHDLDRARRFYEEALGFTFEREIRPPDEATTKLLQLEAPVGLRAAYLRLGSFRLELLTYDDREPVPPRRRRLDDPGLTHLSIGVDDPHALLDRIRDLGGSVVEESDIGVAVFVRDPDGQLIELLPRTFAHPEPPPA